MSVLGGMTTDGPANSDSFLRDPVRVLRGHILLEAVRVRTAAAARGSDCRTEQQLQLQLRDAYVGLIEHTSPCLPWCQKLVDVVSRLSSVNRANGTLTGIAGALGVTYRELGKGLGLGPGSDGTFVLTSDGHFKVRAEIYAWALRGGGLLDVWTQMSWFPAYRALATFESSEAVIEAMDDQSAPEARTASSTAFFKAIAESCIPGVDTATEAVHAARAGSVKAMNTAMKTLAYSLNLDRPTLYKVIGLRHPSYFSNGRTKISSAGAQSDLIAQMVTTIRVNWPRPAPLPTVGLGQAQAPTGLT